MLEAMRAQGMEVPAATGEEARKAPRPGTRVRGPKKAAAAAGNQVGATLML